MAGLDGQFDVAEMKWLILILPYNTCTLIRYFKVATEPSPQAELARQTKYAQLVVQTNNAVGNCGFPYCYFSGTQ